MRGGIDVQIIPAAVGQSDGAIVFWDDNPDIGMVLPRAVQLISEVQWGTGALDGQDCLVLYLFAGEQSVELYIPERLPTTPVDWLDVWELLCAWSPEVLKIRYGSSPADGNRELTLLLPKEEGEGPLDKLRLFVHKARRERDAGGWRDGNGEMLERLEALVPAAGHLRGE